MRTFHLDRVSELSLTDIPIAHGQDAVPDWFETGTGDILARIRFPSSLAPLLGEYLDRAQVEVHGDTSIATMRIADENSLRRLAARRAGALEILEPEAARSAAAEWADAGLVQYR